VCLVDREQGDPILLVQLVEQLQEPLGQQPLRRNVDQVQLVTDEPPPDGARLVGSQRRVQDSRLHADQPQRRDLIGHQRDQRRHHHTDPGPKDRRDLVADRLAAAGRHQDDRIPTGGHPFDDLGLGPTERRVPEHLAQTFEWRHSGVGSGHLPTGCITDERTELPYASRLCAASGVWCHVDSIASPSQ
jgi:hypothetical protein